MTSGLLAIIGGSRLSALTSLTTVCEQRVVRTPYGMPSAPINIIELQGGHRVAFLARHGYRHDVLAHHINYRANIWALYNLGVKAVLSLTAVTGISDDLTPGCMAVPDQIIDYTWGRAHTYFENNADSPHIDFTNPYDESLRQSLLMTAEKQGIWLKSGGVYACTQGPRLESAAEIRRLQKDGADMVGMTGMPETVLAKELDLPYTALTLSIQDAAGMRSSIKRVVSHTEPLRLAMQQLDALIPVWAKFFD